MATIFKVYHPALDRHIALKVLRPALREDRGFFEKFQHKTHILPNLDHPYMIPAHGYPEPVRAIGPHGQK